jgi:hypothetical protein
MKKYFLFILMLTCGYLSAADISAEPPRDEDFLMEVMPMGTPPPDGLAHKFMFISAEELGGKVVKGAPYSAEAVTERTQALADGNRIVNKSSTKIFRDSEGRTRREQQLTLIGKWEASEEPPRTIFIQDPVANVHYVLEPDTKIARKMKFEASRLERAPKPGGAGVQVEVEEFDRPHPVPGPGRHFERQVFQYRMDEKDAKTESLGKQTIEGIPVEGTRTTVTIPAGEMGNEMPIQIVSERWYSPDLQIDIMTRHSDPRFGETVYQLSHISRGEQDRSLFEVPSGYKVENMPMHDKIIRREIKN